MENTEKKNLLVRIFSELTKKRELTATQANLMSRFGSYMDFDKIVSKKIDDVQCQIRQKLEFSNKERLLNLLVPEDQKDLYDKVKEHFDKKGFKTFYAGPSEIPELGNNTYLFLSWDLRDNLEK